MGRFKHQVIRAKRIAKANPLQRTFLLQKEHARRSNIGKSIRHNDTTEYYRAIKSKEVNNLHEKAYANPRGYAIGKVGNDKVMYVSGSRNRMDWLLNATDIVTPHKLRFFQNRTAYNLDKIAKENDVTVVIGHSRGAALVSNMPPGRGYERAGLDGAMIIAHDKDMLNLSQGQPFDKAIALGGRNTHYVKPKGGLRKWHYVMRGG